MVAVFVELWTSPVQVYIVLICYWFLIIGSSVGLKLLKIWLLLKQGNIIRKLIFSSLPRIDIPKEACLGWGVNSPVRYVLKIHFFIEFCLKMIQFKIQFKTKSGIFIQKIYHSIESRIFNRIIHSQKKKIIQNSNIRPKYGFEALLWPL